MYLNQVISLNKLINMPYGQTVADPLNFNAINRFDVP